VTKSIHATRQTEVVANKIATRKERRRSALATMGIGRTKMENLVIKYHHVSSPITEDVTKHVQTKKKKLCALADLLTSLLVKMVKLVYLSTRVINPIMEDATKIAQNLKT